MGCYSFTCALSGLQINADDPVRWLLLTSGSRTVRTDCIHDPHERWFPRTVPVRARYNDYGSVYQIQDRSLFPNLVLDGLRVDLVERGWGRDSCHDVPVTRRSLTWCRLLEAVREGRVRVRDTVGHGARKRKVPHGLPTRNRVERILRRAGLRGLVAEHTWGRVTVRSHGFGTPQWRSVGDYISQDEDAARIAEVLAEHYNVTRETREENRDGARVIVTPKAPVPKPEAPDARAQSGRGSVPVAQAMVREDAWQAALRVFGGTDVHAKTRKKAEAELAMMRNALGPRGQHLPQDMHDVFAELGKDRPSSYTLRVSSGEFRYTMNRTFNPPFTIGPDAAGELILDRVRRGVISIDDPQILEVLCARYELETVSAGLGRTGASWQPSRGGPQEPLWDTLAFWHWALFQISHLEKKKYEQEE